ncbi:hypothetical protein P153DRAFT_48322 [Dothidotthia symphoricarpi CBS 119687]|uniref:Transmembrane protein n=1 Tax=Dothidotthia symphoricarpi CBS 119687 TaxID=1392245 RepID=A0A6A6AAK2_9PLEO|nr:uncharacterized protein P153DRAFT_48322 [Dothidotthia symphoricarpi CBS 119687]KAF2128114.1 hypothetical protein P153DRAFT_48322 [Dothidotthia symphoricarpi CBS 119687]
MWSFAWMVWHFAVSCAGGIAIGLLVWVFMITGGCHDVGNDDGIVTCFYFVSARWCWIEEYANFRHIVEIVVDGMELL